MGRMGERERMLVLLGDLLGKIARPYRAGDELPVEVRDKLWRIGLPCGEQTSRQELIARLWARKRSLMAPMQQDRGGQTPPNAA